MTKNHYLIGILLVLHIVGVVGTLHPSLRELFQILTPINLLISASILIYSHPGNLKKLMTFMSLCFTIGLAIEIIGVNTGFPFGSYQYGAALGWKVLNTPVIIGINWFLLTYGFGMIFQNTRLPRFMRAFLAAIAMVCLDYLIEPIAISLDYWTWLTPEIPLNNYLGWFGVSFILQIIFCYRAFPKSNIVAFGLIAGEIIYFASLSIWENF